MTIGCIGAIAFGALVWWMIKNANGVIERPEPPSVAEFSESIVALDRDGKPGDIQTVQNDLRRIGEALSEFRTRHGRMPAGSPLLPGDEFRKASGLTVADLTAPNRPPQGWHFENYSLEFSGPRLDNTGRDVPPVQGRDVWVRCAYELNGEPRALLLRPDGEVQDLAERELGLVITVSRALTGNGLRYVRVPYDQAGVPVDAMLVIWPELHLVTFPMLPSSGWRSR